VNREVRSPVILLVEDQAAVRRVITEMLCRHGFQVLTAAAAADGQALFDKHHEEISLVVLDMIMPGMSGLDLAASLTRTHPAMKILYISGYVDSIAIQSISRRSSEVVLCKPFTEESLVERVRQLVGGQPAS
jgi:CheY-like chemotaxis protein